MVKILGRAGVSLADVYDVVGSRAGLEQLESREVSLVHEMGQTIFSERFSLFVRRATSGALMQSVNFNIVLSDLPSGAWRILGVMVFADVQGRALLASVAVRDPLGGRELPFWVWDSAGDSDLVRVRMEDNGAGVAQHRVLQPAPALIHLPGLGAGDQPQSMSEIAFRGSTNAFGAGTVTLTMILQIGFSQVGGLDSHGLPIPSW